MQCSVAGVPCSRVDDFCRLGYPLTLLRRRDLLHALYTSLEDMSRIRVGTKVVDIAPRVASEPDGPLCVTTASGEVYTGDIVVGADGVHGVVREHMWRIPGLQKTPKGKTNQVRTEKGAMTVDYYTILGATPAAESRLTEMIRPGDMHMRCDKGVLLTLIANSDGSVNWFAAFKMDRTRVHPDLPEKLSQEEIRATLEEYAEWKAWDGGAYSSDITFGDLWRVSPWVSATHLQEGLFDTWSCGRITCIGDTVFKVRRTPIERIYRVTVLTSCSSRLISHRARICASSRQPLSPTLCMGSSRRAMQQPQLSTRH